MLIPLLFGLSGAEIGFILLLLGLMFLPPIAAIVHVLSRPIESNLKLIWVLISIFVPLGWLVYFIYYLASPRSNQKPP
jgi:hypothetical protein